ncbi:tetratricopeptide repeat protein [Thiohalomonas denitrificans]|uniref:Flp pilus assembly protein TadD, contains TPR repeats n=1 Tax=Thiohalomonas denitrificans TaxID=415747 RepID=A0A1G5Q7R8_9GAMM|nr:tetratricopeptide repeat protein [Thiohalomonas denitrificans]SCZ57904.1 Flp pilus assembly protein TadD, contains TPR repeats [Thiohalomonas denitrificans]
MRKYLIVAIGGLLAGCSTLSQNAPETGEGQQPSTAVQQESAPESSPEPLPEPGATSRIEPRMLYQLLVAEFAGQRGDLGLSARSYLNTARSSRDPQVARRAVHVAVYGRDYERARDAAELWVELEPDSVEARQSLAALQIKAGQLDAAVEHLGVVLDSFGDDLTQGFSLVTSLLSREQNGKHALQVMQQLMQKYPGNMEALYAYAELAGKIGDNGEALKALDQILDANPERVEALILKANLLHRTRQPAEAVAAMQRAVELQPENSNLRLSYARLLVDAQRLEAARRQFRSLESELPDDPDIAHALGLLAIQAEDLDEAERYFRKLLESDQHKSQAALALGQIAESQDDPQQAIQWYNSVSGEAFMDARLRVALLIANEDGLDAAREYLHGLELGAPEQRLRRVMAEGMLLSDAQRHEEAMAVYSRGLESFEGNSDLLYARAMASERVDRIDLLEQDLKTILESEPDNTQALNALGYTLADRTDRYEEAKSYIERAYEQAPADPAIVDSMGWVLYRLGEHEEALNYLRRALSLQHDGEIAAHLGEVLWVTGQRDQAREIWDEALEYAPEHELLQNVIERFTSR